MNNIDNLRKYINVINFVIRKIENDNDVNDEIVKTVCLNVNQNIDTIKNILSKKNLDDESSIDSTENNNEHLNDTDSNMSSENNANESDDENFESVGNESDDESSESPEIDNKEEIIYYQKYPNQKRKLEIFNKSIFIF
jgi:hypothetical protein